MEDIEKLKKKYDEMINKCKELYAEIEKLEKEKKNKRWRATEDGDYYYVKETLDVDIDHDSNTNYDDDLYNLGNYFKTEEEAQKVANKIKTYIELKQLAEELNGDEEIDWDDEEQEKYHIWFNCNENKILSAYNYSTKEVGQIYCTDGNFLNKALEQIGEERLKELFE